MFTCSFISSANTCLRVNCSVYFSVVFGDHAQFSSNRAAGSRFGGESQLNEIQFTSSVVFKSSSGAEISITRSDLRPICLDGSCHAAIFSSNLQLEPNRVPRGGQPSDPSC